MSKNLRTRFVAYFFIVMLIASVIATGVTYLYLNVHMSTQMQSNQHQLAQKIIDIAQSDGILLDMPSDTGYEVYSVQRVDDSPLMSDEIRQRLDKGEIVSVDHVLMPVSDTFFSAGGQYYQISLFPNSSLLLQLLVSLLVTVASALVLGTLLASVAGKRYLRPIRELSAAIAQVAKGNFDVSVKPQPNSEMGCLAENFNSMAHDLSQIETLQRDFISNVSHEFKTPLSSISGYAKLLKTGVLSDDERNEYYDIISSESERLAALTSNILRLSKLEHCSAPPEKREYSLDEQLRRVIVLLEPQWSRKSITIEPELDSETIEGCPELLQEVWTNLIGNAIKYSSDGGRVFIRLFGGLDNVTVEIEDEGCGMTPQVLERIFERFYQGERSHSAEGNGLGLALVKQICLLCGANIDVESVPGEGSLFRITLPRE